MHRELLKCRKLLADVYRRYYKYLAQIVLPLKLPATTVVELGSEGSSLHEYLPAILRTEVVSHRECDCVVDAHDLLFRDASLAALVMVGVFHHLAKPTRFLQDAGRVLCPGGLLVMIEPSDSRIHGWIVRRFHKSETYDLRSPDWSNELTGRLAGANNALPSIVFLRDRGRFNQEFPQLRMRSIRRHTFLQFYLSGGRSYPPVCPAWLSGAVGWWDRGLALVSRHLTTEMTIEIERIS